MTGERAAREGPEDHPAGGCGLDAFGLDARMRLFPYPGSGEPAGVRVGVAGLRPGPDVLPGAAAQHRGGRLRRCPVRHDARLHALAGQLATVDARRNRLAVAGRDLLPLTAVHAAGPGADFARRVHGQRAAQEALLADSERAVLEDTLLGQLATQIHTRTIEARDLVAGWTPRCANAGCPAA